MPLFACSACDGYDNSALTRSWSEQRDARAEKRAMQPLCSACDPEIGTWHGRFPRRTRQEAGLTVVDSRGYLWTPDEARALPGAVLGYTSEKLALKERTDG